MGIGGHNDDKGSAGLEGLDDGAPPAVAKVDTVVHPDIEAALAEVVGEVAGVWLIFSGVRDEDVVSHIVLHSSQL